MRTDRLHVKLLKPSDINDEIMEWFQDEELMRYYTSSKKAISKNELCNSIDIGLKNGKSFSYVIIHNDSNEFIGTIKIGPINIAHKISDLVVLIGNRKFLGKGLGSEAISLGNKVAFELHDLRKLFGGMYETNLASIKAYTKSGWIVEGLLKGHYLVNGKSVDRILVGCFNPRYFEKSEIEKAKHEDWYKSI